MNSEYSEFEQNCSIPGLGGNGLPIIKKLHKSFMFLQTDDLVKHSAPSFTEYQLACLRTIAGHKQPILL